MRVSHLLVPTLLISLWVATAAAQSSPQASFDFSRPASVLIEDPVADLVLFPFLTDPQYQPDSTPDVTQGLHDAGNASARFQLQSIFTPEEDAATCLKLRVYRVARENRESDSTRPLSSTCQPAARFQLRTTVDSQEIRLR